MLFKKRKNTTSQLAQNEREAIVDLLHLCLYADAHISLSEGDFIADVVDVIGWDENLSFASYEPRSIAQARAVRTEEIQRRAFIDDAASRLQSAEAKQLALDLCQDLCAADGMDSRETTFLAQIRSSLGL